VITMPRIRRTLALLALAFLLTSTLPADLAAQDASAASQRSTFLALDWLWEGVAHLAAKIGLEFDPNGIAMPDEDDAAQAEEAVGDPPQGIGAEFEPNG
jgi:hypothetical protein